MDDSVVSIVKFKGCKVMIVSDGHNLESVLMLVEQAIRGAGFCPSGQLEFVEVDDVS